MDKFFVVSAAVVAGLVPTAFGPYDTEQAAIAATTKRRVPGVWKVYGSVSGDARTVTISEPQVEVS